MPCEETGLLLHALMDGELDAGCAREVEAHLTICQSCAALKRQQNELHKPLKPAALQYKAPVALRRRVEAIVAVPHAMVPQRAAPDRRSLLKGFAMGAMMSAAAAASIVVVSFRVA